MSNRRTDIRIIYSDSHIVVADKPGGLLSVPGRGQDKQDCVVSRIRKIFPLCIEQPSVHRLDMYTSGLMVLALTEDSHRNLSIQFQKRFIVKQYTAVLEGIIPGASGRITLPFRLDPDNRPYQVYDPVNGKAGTTLWEKISEEGGRTRIRFIPLTGRTHQLRLHSSHPLGLRAPVAGDILYGSGEEGDMMMLHASFLEFTHPATGERVNFISDPPF